MGKSKSLDQFFPVDPRSGVICRRVVPLLHLHRVEEHYLHEIRSEGGVWVPAFGYVRGREQRVWLVRDEIFINYGKTFGFGDIEGDNSGMKQAFVAMENSLIYLA